MPFRGNSIVLNAVLNNLHDHTWSQRRMKMFAKRVCHGYPHYNNHKPYKGGQP